MRNCPITSSGVDAAGVGVSDMSERETVVRSRTGLNLSLYNS